MDGICSMSGTLRALSVVGVLITIAKIMIPIVLIIKGTIDIGKNIVSQKPDELSKSAALLGKRILAGLIIFLLPSLIEGLVDLLVNPTDIENEFVDCHVCLYDVNDCKSLISIAEYQEAKSDIDLGEDAVVEGKYVAETSSTSTTGDGDYKDAEVVGGGEYFDPNDVTKISGLTADELIEKLNRCTHYGGKAKRYVPYANALIEAEKKHGLNVFYMMGVYSLESGWGGSDLARKCNNWGGIKYYSSQTYFGKHTTKCWQQSTGAWFAGYENVDGFIEYHANLIEKNYVTPGAKYYKGKTPKAIAQTYGHLGSVDTVIEIASNLSNA